MKIVQKKIVKNITNRHLLQAYEWSNIPSTEASIENASFSIPFSNTSGPAAAPSSCKWKEWATPLGPFSLAYAFVWSLFSRPWHLINKAKRFFIPILKLSFYSPAHYMTTLPCHIRINTRLASPRGTSQHNIIYIASFSRISGMGIIASHRQSRDPSPYRVRSGQALRLTLNRIYSFGFMICSYLSRPTLWRVALLWYENCFLTRMKTGQRKRIGLNSQLLFLVPVGLPSHHIGKPHSSLMYRK